MVKVPATPEGVPAVEELIAAGVNVNVTLIFALDAYENVITRLHPRAAAAAGCAVNHSTSTRWPPSS